MWKGGRGSTKTTTTTTTTTVRLVTLMAVAGSVCLAEDDAQRRVGIRRGHGRVGDGGDVLSEPCHQMASCSECIQSPECAWCADPEWHPEWDPVIHSDLTFSDLSDAEYNSSNSKIEAKEIKARCDRVTK